MTLYRIIYLWNGERHVADTTRDLAEAKDTLHLLRRDGWNAWIESSID